MDIHCPPPLIVITLFVSEATHTFTKLFNNAVTSAFLSATSTASLKLNSILKLQKPLRNAGRHLLSIPSDAPSSYSSISLISCTFILFKKIVLGQLIYFLEYNNFLTPVQAGLRHGRLTLD